MQNAVHLYKKKKYLRTKFKYISASYKAVIKKLLFYKDQLNRTLFNIHRISGSKRPLQDK